MSEKSGKNNIGLLNIEVPSSLDTAVQNLTDKPTQVIGQTFADLWFFAFGGFSHIVAKRKVRYAAELEQYRKEIEAKVKAIPEEKQTEPPLQVVGQALEDSKFCVESKELRDLFSNLIANSMNIDYSSKVHPSFSKIIQQMSPLDAQMLMILRDPEYTSGIAVVDYRASTEDKGFRDVLKCVPEVLPDNCSVDLAIRSIQSLQRLGIIQIPDDLHFVDDSKYAVFESGRLHDNLASSAKSQGCTLTIEKRIARLTDLGRDFAAVCCQ